MYLRQLRVVTAPSGHLLFVCSCYLYAGGPSFRLPLRMGVAQVVEVNCTSDE